MRSAPPSPAPATTRGGGAQGGRLGLLEPARTPGTGPGGGQQTEQDHRRHPRHQHQDRGAASLEHDEQTRCTLAARTDEGGPGSWLKPREESARSRGQEIRNRARRAPVTGLRGRIPVAAAGAGRHVALLLRRARTLGAARRRRAAFRIGQRGKPPAKISARSRRRASGAAAGERRSGATPATGCNGATTRAARACWRGRWRTKRT